MIPTTITGLAVVALMLLPGFVFVTSRERHQPARRLSALRETSKVLAATAVSYLIPAVILVVLACLFPERRRDLADLVSSPQTFVQDHPFRMAVGLVSVVLLASVVAGLLGSPRFNFLIPRSGGSAWWHLFEEAKPHDTTDIQVAVTLADDAVLTGVLHSWNRDADDHGDRELVLSSPIWLQPPESGVVERLETEVLAIASRQIKYLSVQYLLVGTESPSAVGESLLAVATLLERIDEVSESSGERDQD